MAGNGPKTCIDANRAYCARVGNPVPNPKLGLLHCVLLLFRTSRAAVFCIAKEGLWASNMMEDGGKGLQSVQDMEAEFRDPPEIRHRYGDVALKVTFRSASHLYAGTPQSRPPCRIHQWWSCMGILDSGNVSPARSTSGTSGPLPTKFPLRLLSTIILIRITLESH